MSDKLFTRNEVESLMYTAAAIALGSAADLIDQGEHKLCKNVQEFLRAMAIQMEDDADTSDLIDSVIKDL